MFSGSDEKNAYQMLIKMATARIEFLRNLRTSKLPNNSKDLADIHLSEIHILSEFLQQFEDPFKNPSMPPTEEQIKEFQKFFGLNEHKLNREVALTVHQYFPTMKNTSDYNTNKIIIILENYLEHLNKALQDETIKIFRSNFKLEDQHYDANPSLAAIKTKLDATKKMLELLKTGKLDEFVQTADAYKTTIDTRRLNGISGKFWQLIDGLLRSLKINPGVEGAKVSNHITKRQGLFRAGQQEEKPKDIEEQQQPKKEPAEQVIHLFRKK